VPAVIVSAVKIAFLAEIDALPVVPPKQVGFVPPFGSKDTKSREQNKINSFFFYAETEYLRQSQRYEKKL
jgi:hypothetical protein